MRRTTLVVAAAAVALVSANAFAQAKPNFAGKWTLVPDAAAAAAAAGGGGGGGGRGGGRGGGGLGMEVTISQDANTITTVRTTQAGEVKAVYKLDGSESKNMVMPGGRGGADAAPPTPIEQVAKAKWDGARIVIVTTVAGRQGGTPTEQTMALSLDASGSLVVERTQPGRGGGEPTTTKQTYKKG